MRRSERERFEPELFQWIMDNADVGYLSTVLENGYPRIIPLDFVALDGKIYFHGAPEGEKFECISAGGKMSFCAVVPFSVMPSQWFAEDYACSATHFFKSALVYGDGCIVEDKREKAAALQALMEKYQPEGKYRKISADDRVYDKHLRRTAVFRLDPVKTTMKVNIGQSYSEKIRMCLADKLEERGRELDLATAAEIRKTLG